MTVVEQVKTHFINMAKYAYPNLQINSSVKIIQQNGIDVLKGEQTMTINKCNYNLRSVDYISDFFKVLDCSVDIITDFKFKKLRVCEKKINFDKFIKKNNSNDFSKMVFNLYAIFQRLRNQIEHNRYTISDQLEKFDILSQRDKVLFTMEKKDIKILNELVVFTCLNSRKNNTFQLARIITAHNYIYNKYNKALGEGFELDKKKSKELDCFLHCDHIQPYEFKKFNLEDKVFYSNYVQNYYKFMEVSDGLESEQEHAARLKRLSIDTVEFLYHFKFDTEEILVSHSVLVKNKDITIRELIEKWNTKQDKYIEDF